MIELENISKIGIGTWGLAGYLHYDEAVDLGLQLNALKREFDLGANYIDCSLKYSDGKSLELIKKLIRHVGRGNIFISVKLEQFIETAGDVEAQLEHYLKELDINSVDLLQLHAPSFTKFGIQETYREIAKFIQSEKVRYAGASNFSVEQLREAANGLGQNIALHESLFNFTFRQNEDAGILEFCKANNIKFVAYQPLHRGKTEKLQNSILTSFATKYNKTQSQIILNWLMRKNIVPLIRSDNVNHLVEDFDSQNFIIEDDDFKLIDEYRDADSISIDVDWEDKGLGRSVYQIVNL